MFEILYLSMVTCDAHLISYQPHILEILVHLNQIAVKYICEIKYMRAYVKIDTGFSFANLFNHSKPFLTIQF